MPERPGETHTAIYVAVVPGSGAPLATGWTGGALSTTRGLAEPLREMMGF